MKRALLFLLLAVGTATAQEWEFRVCAEPNNLPYSNRALEGFENRIAEIVARELGAELTYEWLPRPSSRYREAYLRSGRCDAVMGIADGHEGFLTSLAYYRSTYVFAYPGASGGVASLDDPRLGEMTIAVAGGGRTGPERLALAERGLQEKLIVLPPDYSRPIPHSAPIEAVAEGRADLAIVWGPVAGFAAREVAADLELVPVTPQVGRAFLPMVIPVSIGVRPQDTALRDVLNRALASRWEEIQGVLRSYSVPLEPLPRPTTAGIADAGDERLNLGIVLPLASGTVPLDPSAPHAAAGAALQGALLAEEEQPASDAAIRLSWASAPGPEAARRAAQRLVRHPGVDILVGGIDATHDRVLSEVAAENDLVYFDMGTQGGAPAAASAKNTFYLDASSGTYLQGIATAGRQAGVESWYVVYDDDGRSLVEAAVAVLGNVVASNRAGGGTVDVMADIRRADPDAVLMLLDWRSQLEFLGFYDAFGLEPKLYGMPNSMTQTRTFYLAVRRTAIEADALERVTVWGAESGSGPAQELAQRYYARWGVAMDAPAWLGYQAVSIAGQAAARGVAAPSLTDYLEAEGTTFTAAVGSPLRFDPRSHRLVQPLYLLRIDPEGASLGRARLLLEGAGSR